MLQYVVLLYSMLTSGVRLSYGTFLPDTLLPCMNALSCDATLPNRIQPLRERLEVNTTVKATALFIF